MVEENTHTPFKLMDQNVFISFCMYANKGCKNSCYYRQAVYNPHHCLIINWREKYVQHVVNGYFNI